MSDETASILDRIPAAVLTETDAGTFVVVLLIASLFLTAAVWQLPRPAQAVLRTGGWLAVLGGLALGQRGSSWLTALDRATTGWLVDHRTSDLDTAARVLTDLGSPVTVAVAAMIAVALLYRQTRSWFPAVLLLTTLSLASVACLTLKHLLNRPRPPRALQLVVETNPAFPSGHVTGTTVLLGVVAACLATGAGHRRWLPPTAVAGGVLIIGVTRVYLGVHWLTDVAAGAALGMAFVTAATAVLAARPHRVSMHDRIPTEEAAPTAVGAA